MKELQEFMDVQNEWATKTFGNGDGTGTLNHLKEEVKELIEAVAETNKEVTECRAMDVSGRAAQKIHEERMEFADCFILLLNAASKRGLTAKQLMDLAKQKQYINMYEREWGEVDENGVAHHIKK
jgi:hypothetical protein